MKKILCLLLAVLMLSTLCGCVQEGEYTAKGAFTIFGVTASCGKQNVYLQEFGYNRTQGSCGTLTDSIPPYMGSYDETNTMTFRENSRKTITVNAEGFQNATVSLHLVDGTEVFSGTEVTDEILLEVPDEPGEYIFSVHVYWERDDVNCGLRVIVE